MNLQQLRAWLGRVKGLDLDRRDALGLVGLVLLVMGGERLLPGAGQAAAGAALLAIAALVR